jgi:CelD/BcsL family acetyltransferase involved in cellulose biosynthesis
MTISQIDPVADHRWQRFVDEHPNGGIFHTSGWLDALRRTYGYEPVAYVATGLAGDIVAGVPFCRIHSRLTGRRLVSLPFSDHCQPLTTEPTTLAALMETARQDAANHGSKYIEFRPLTAAGCDPLVTELGPEANAVMHRLDLTAGQEQIFRALDKQCVRKITRSERENVRYEEGRSDELLHKFYRLLVLTRRRHGIPPQPFRWFENLVACLGDKVKIRLASKDATAIASIVTLSYKRVVTYKYGSSDSRFNPLGGTSLLFWRTILDGIGEECSELDLGRSDFDNPGLIAFKDHWGAAKTELTYYRHPRVAPTTHRLRASFRSVAERLLPSVPDSLFTALGGLIYRHVG